MKILQVIPNFCFGGAEIMCENLTRGLMQMGYEVSAVSLYDVHTPVSERMEKAGVRIRYLDKKPGLDVSMVPKLVRILKQERPDVVHTHLDVIKYAALAAKLAKVKKSVHTVHNIAQKEAGGLTQKIINGCYFKLGWSAPVALSPEVRRTVCAFYGMDAKRVPVIYNGIDLSRCIPKERYETGDTVTLVHIGRFHKQKNHAGLLKAFQLLHAQYPQCRLHLLGDGELRTEMEEYAAQLGISDWVRFWGNQSNVYPFLHDADVFVLPSLYEGIPMTVIEAMGTGLPIVAAAVGGIPDMLQNEKNALLVPCEAEAVSRACAQLISDPALRMRLGQSARQDSQRFSAGHMAERYGEVYAGLYRG